MQLSPSPSFSAEKKGILRSKIHLFRNTVFALLSAASLSFAQDKPVHNELHRGASQDINFMHPDDPGEEALDHLIPNDHHIHTIAEAHYSHNHATPDGNLEIGELAGFGLHSQVPLSHTHDSSTLAKIGFHGLVSTNHTDPLRREFNFDFGLIHRTNDGKWKFGAGVNLLHEVSKLNEIHSHTETHISGEPGHEHEEKVTHTETVTHSHEYSGAGFYFDVAYQMDIFKKKINLIGHFEHDQSRTGSGNFISAGFQANKFSIIPDRLHLDLALMAVVGDGERFKSRNACLMPSVAVHLLLSKNSTLYASWVRIIPPGNSSQTDNGNAFSVGISRTF